MKIRPLAILLVLIASLRPGFAQTDARDYVIGLTATTSENPPSVTLNWAPHAGVTRATVFRRAFGSVEGWGKATTLKTTDSTYTDTTVEPGAGYEYYVYNAIKVGSTSWEAKGYLASGVKVQSDLNGAVILIVDETVVAPLTNELTRLVSDMQAEGYRVIRHDVSRTQSVESVKSLIEADYFADLDHVTTVFLFGHVPVPYSGDIAPDGHVPGSGNHQGSWACDSYYGNFDGNWTDDQVNDTTAYRPENRNVPGDGKFDQSSIDAAMNLEVGRVDLSNMPAFDSSEIALLRAYLNKDHGFRTDQLVVPHKALIDINFGVFAWYDVPGEDAWRYFPALVGHENIVNFHTVSTDAKWIDHLESNSYLWAYGCGAGSYNSCSGVGVTADFAQKQAKAVFYNVFGSFFGDWDSQNNFTRAPLASGNGLASCWVSRPFWFFHPMGLGKTLGYCTKITMDNGVAYRDYNQGIQEGGAHLALMGDPTLRQQYAPALENLSAVVKGAQVELSWPVIAGMNYYNVYRASSSTAPFERLTESPYFGAAYTDSAALPDTNIYLVRPADLIQSPSGTYFAEGPGAMQKVFVENSGVDIVRAGSQALHVSQTRDLVTIDVRLNGEPKIDLTIVDPLGRVIRVLESGSVLSGTKSFTLETRELASGLYFAKLHTASAEYSSKILIVK